ncbi:MAG: NADH-quinone oxidoreductase subunit M [Puia sp.]|nr:NADH-quinone oxidoreductase subunit M [Puia sp.]
MNLSLLILLPFLTSLALLVCKGDKPVRLVAAAGSFLQVGACVVLLCLYWKERASGNTAEMLFQNDPVWYAPLGIHYHTGVDGISVAMLLLTSLIVFAGVLVSWNLKMLSKEFFFLLLLLSAGAYGFFVSLDLFTMFFFLEMAVIPKFLLIGIWGSSTATSKEYAATKLVLMLMGGSALVFVGLAGIYFQAGAGRGMHSFDLLQIARMNIPVETQKWIFPFIFIGFGVFAALFPFHTWVPDGHSSAPTAASMFLAGISMKLGGYGCLRVATYLLPAAAHYYSGVIVLLSAIAILYGAFATMMQTDLKYINAYSSVSHCGFVLLGIGMLTQTSINGAVLQMVSHGLMTALFFACIGMIYDRTHTRAVAKLGGLLKMMPFLSTAFVLAGLCSLGLPGLSGFVAELTVFMGSWQRVDAFYRWATIAACGSIVVTAVYILRAVGQTIMGGGGSAVRDQAGALKDAAWNERLAIAILVIGIVVIGVAPFWLNGLIAPAGESIMLRVVGAAH